MENIHASTVITSNNVEDAVQSLIEVYSRGLLELRRALLVPKIVLVAL